MEILRPDTLADAVAARAAHPGALALRGGTDVMVELNFGRTDPDALLDLSRVAELGDWGEEDGRLRIGAGVTHARVAAELAASAPGLAAASAHRRLAARSATRARWAGTSAPRRRRPTPSAPSACSTRRSSSPRPAGAAPRAGRAVRDRPEGAPRSPPTS